MQTELPLFEKPSINKALPDWMKDRLRSDRREPKYHPSRTRKKLLSLLRFDDWTGFISLPEMVDQSAEQTDHVIDFLLKKGRIERTPLYFLNPKQTLLSDRTIHPGYDNYMGFEFGYRLKNCSPM
jgi:hypothetical protein